MTLHPAFAPGHTAVITGAADGIGLAAARRCLAHGMNVVLADIEAEKLASTVIALGAGDRVLAVPTDVADSVAVTALRDQALARFGAVYVLMNNAGMGGGGSALEKPDRWRRLLEVNLFGVINGVQAFGAMMVAMKQADGLVSGTNEISGSVLRPLFQIIKVAPKTTTASSCMVMEVEDTRFGERGVLFMGDCGVIPEPTVDQLADISISTARLARQISGVRPRVALLSYSTKGSATQPSLMKVKAATGLAQQKAHEMGFRRPGLTVREPFAAAHERRYEAGFLTACAHLPEMRPVPSLITPQVPDGPALARWVRRHRPDVILDAEERHDCDLLRAAGWRVPEDIGVLSLCAPRLGGPLSGCVQDGGSIGATGIDYLLSLIERNETGIPEVAATLSIDARWNPGETLGRGAAGRDQSKIG
jgi:NAD(P)-dependent dehydrogenase (short-subunit alcohol dehydrogenase family)